jgi:hypothetical protein
MRTKRGWAGPALALLAIAAVPRSAAAQQPTVITEAGEAAFTGAPVYRGVRLSGVSFGAGGTVLGNGSAFGNFSFAFHGVAVSGGQARTMNYGGGIQGGAVSPSGVVSVSGSGTLDPGDGSPVVTSVPFLLEITPNVDSQGTLAFTLEAVHLTAALISEGGVGSSTCQPRDMGASLLFQNAQTFAWSAAPEATSYNVYRGAMQTGAFGLNQACFAPGLAGTTTNDATVPPTGTGLYYLVAMKNACGEGSLGVGSSGSQAPNPLPCP